MSLKYAPALDGIRGLSVLAVILTHYGYLPFGWIGVQVFFVLSGYLITEKLLEDRAAPLVDYLKRFYRRRIFRIFPLYYLYLLLLAVAFLLTHKPQTLPAAFGWLATYTYNFRRVMDGRAESPYFSHLWSLSIEEQFYLFWPLLVFWAGKARLWLALAVVIIAAPCLRFYLADNLAGDSLHIGNAVYNFTACQVDAFAVGAAITLMKRVHLAGGWFAGSIALIILAGILRLGWWSPYPGHPIDLTWMYSLLDVSAGLLIVYALQSSPRVLTWPPLVYVGKISYGVYVYHWGLQYFLFTRLHIAEGSTAAALLFLPYLALVIGIASASYWGFEAKLLRYKKGVARHVAVG